VKTVAKKSTKTRRRPSVSNQSTNKLNNGYEQQTETSSGLDQVAKSLFSNQKTATLEFADPQLAMEFASLMGRCQQLEEVSIIFTLIKELSILAIVIFSENNIIN